jgi:2-oxoglutarate ferredoxin oxidoreductase subunit alpha
MSDKLLMKGNEAMAEAAIRAGCQAYFGYPITPQNEVPAYMARRMPELGRTFVQAESELAAINMVFGAGAAGVRVMTSSSSPGISLMQEGLSYIAAAEVPAVIANMMRGGPGLGNIKPSQADYIQSVMGGGHGDYHLIVVAPSTVQELADLTIQSFDLSMKYRNPVMILGDGILGQITEPVILPPLSTPNDNTDWGVAQGGKEQRIVNSLFLFPENQLETHNWHLQEKYAKIQKEYSACEQYKTNDAEFIIVAYGTVGRICKSAVDMMRERGLKIGLFRPISLWPFPDSCFSESTSGKKHIFVVEMAMDQLEKDVRLHLEGSVPVKGFNKLGGAIFTEEEVSDLITAFMKEAL